MRISGAIVSFKEALSSGAGMVLSEAQRAQDENERAESLAKRTYSGRKQWLRKYQVYKKIHPIF